ncbi:MAG: M23 family metallopeptidase [Nevskia sp.]|nr:M23 family metallopeptidase [Nevskia sp.]
MGQCKCSGRLSRKKRCGLGLLAGGLLVVAAPLWAAVAPALPLPSQPLMARPAAPSPQAAALAMLKPPLSKQLVTSPFGWRDDPLHHGRGFHRGVDYGAARGTAVHAAQDGTITAIGKLRGFGRIIRIRHGAGVETLYAHLARFARGLHLGSTLRCGEVIGEVGSSGRSTGPHLHYEVLADGRTIDPQNTGGALPLHVARADATRP